MHPRKYFRISLRDRTLELGPKTLIMGVLNITPDSFSDGGEFLNPSRAVDRAWEIAEEGADILDLGGESTRPGSHGVGAAEEMRRILPVLEALNGKYPLPVSVDTAKAPVARAALDRGAVMINDVTGLNHDPSLAGVVASTGSGLALVHMRGTPLDMQAGLPSEDILSEIGAWAVEAVAKAGKAGVSSEKIILDPGIGFGKTASQNLEILRNLGRLARLGFPLLVGTSRKSFIGAILDRPVEERIHGTAASVAVSIFFGAHIVRVHDVRAMKDVARFTDAVIHEGSVE